ncbi:hypothetical protein EW146_g6167 [Bondarzewia mesenterica]|uniref:Uncharacterized protein n=1 Tax=Bondarzewia mesenterica TaxID=1095465 RepID=A0A4S4LPC2_9AGAM|nr:hypothetical protein EW146_g6167 [Bondarzewia mesenterica]
MARRMLDSDSGASDASRCPGPTVVSIPVSIYPNDRFRSFSVASPHIAGWLYLRFLFDILLEERGDRWRCEKFRTMRTPEGFLKTKRCLPLWVVATEPKRDACGDLGPLQEAGVAARSARRGSLSITVASGVREFPEAGQF